MAELAFAAGAIFVASFVQGLIGFGSGMISLTLLVLIWEVQEVVAITAVFSLFLCLYLAWQLREHISIQEIRPLLAGALLGVPIGVTALTELDPRFIKGALGLFLVAYSSWSLWGRSGGGTAISSKWGYPAGLGSGVLSGAFNTGGPPVVLYGTERQWPPSEFRGNIQGFFAPCAIFALSLLAYKGVVTAESLRINLQLLPFLIVGMVLGDKLADGVEESRFRTLLFYALMAIGLGFSKALFTPTP
jgi:hypothetical protein